MKVPADFEFLELTGMPLEIAEIRGVKVEVRERGGGEFLRIVFIF